VRLIASKMDPSPVVLSLDPQTLEDVLEDMTVVGEAVGLQESAAIAKGILEDRIKTVVAAADMVLAEKGEGGPQVGINCRVRVRVSFRLVFG
jgi:ABC-type Fe3+-hydroxamate transport system substrate-binding protein